MIAVQIRGELNGEKPRAAFPATTAVRNANEFEVLQRREKIGGDDRDDYKGSTSSAYRDSGTAELQRTEFQCETSASRVDNADQTPGLRGGIYADCPNRSRTTRPQTLWVRRELDPPEFHQLRYIEQGFRTADGWE